MHLQSCYIQASSNDLTLRPGGVVQSVHMFKIGRHKRKHLLFECAQRVQIYAKRNRYATVVAC